MNLNTALIHRNPVNNHIDVQLSLQAVAKELIAQRDEEQRLRKVRRYKTAVLKTFEEGHGFQIAGSYGGQMFFHLNPLVDSVVRKLRHKKEDAARLRNEVTNHILLNHKRYLQVVTFKVYNEPVTHVLLSK